MATQVKSLKHDKGILNWFLSFFFLLVMYVSPPPSDSCSTCLELFLFTSFIILFLFWKMASPGEHIPSTKFSLVLLYIFLVSSSAIDWLRETGASSSCCSHDRDKKNLGWSFFLLFFTCTQVSVREEEKERRITLDSSLERIKEDEKAEDEVRMLSY